MNDIGEMVFMPKVLDHLARVVPGLQIRTTAGPLPQRLLAMERGEMDLLIGHFPDASGAEILQRLMFESGFVCLARQGHPAICDGTISVEAFRLAFDLTRNARRRRTK